MSFMQYLRDTRGELRHVAWPTRVQTFIFTALVILLSVAIALYLGVFDYVFTSALERVLDAMGVAPAPTLEVATSTDPVTIVGETAPVTE